MFRDRTRLNITAVDIGSLRFFFVGSWGSQLLCKPFFSIFYGSEENTKTEDFFGGGGGGVGGRRIKLYTDNIKYYCNLKS